MIVDNKGPTDADVYIDFVDGSITGDESQNKACEPSWTIGNFWQFVWYDENTIRIKAWTTQQSTIELEYPNWFAWMSYGCVTLQIVDSVNDESDDMFRVVSRRANFIDVLVWGDLEVAIELTDQESLPFESISENTKLAVYKNPDTNDWIARVELKNTWNIAQKVQVTPTITDMFGNKFTAKNSVEKLIVWDEIQTSKVLNWKKWVHDWEPVEKKVLPGDSVSFEYVLNSTMQVYKWKFKLDATITSTPVFEFVAATVTEDLKKSVTTTLTTSFTIIPYLLICAFITMVFTIILIVANKEKEE